MSRFTNPVPQFWLDNGEVASSGRMYFFENKNYSTPKATYFKPDNTIPNTHPVKLDGQGRMPPCHGEGLYSVKFYAANPDNPNIDGALQWTRDDVSLSELTGQFELWNAAETYTINDIAKDPADGLYYQLYGAVTSIGEQPSASLAKWELVYFLTGYNNNKPYQKGANVVFDGYIYRANTNVTGVSPPSSQWDNLTFNNSIAGNLSVGGILSASSLSVSGAVSFTTALPVAQGGTGGNTPALARTGLELGSAAVLSYQTSDVPLNGDISGTIRCSKVGNMVTISTTGTISHASLSAPITLAGVVPAAFLPLSDVGFCYAINRTLGYLAYVSVLSTGRITIEYNDFAGAAVLRTASPAFSLSFNN